ncbi:hypothetical protein CC78DRAFT_536101 [Lojkania enalia]|uniref:Uncharacterized protein n=1 Tax=Lojkania enalia TaxID=147567 RepID=A0A9P4K424_9PLEO|nr:hypothetical protein CC78DRAFT_536101 [Didymosphaeria enalia]
MERRAIRPAPAQTRMSAKSDASVRVVNRIPSADIRQNDKELEKCKVERGMCEGVGDVQYKSEGGVIREDVQWGDGSLLSIRPRRIRDEMVRNGVHKTPAKRRPVSCPVAEFGTPRRGRQEGDEMGLKTPARRMGGASMVKEFGTARRMGRLERSGPCESEGLKTPARRPIGGDLEGAVGRRRGIGIGVGTPIKLRRAMEDEMKEMRIQLRRSFDADSLQNCQEEAAGAIENKDEVGEGQNITHSTNTMSTLRTPVRNQRSIARPHDTRQRTTPAKERPRALVTPKFARSSVFNVPQEVQSSPDLYPSIKTKPLSSIRKPPNKSISVTPKPIRPTIFDTSKPTPAAKFIAHPATPFKPPMPKATSAGLSIKKPPSKLAQALHKREPKSQEPRFASAQDISSYIRPLKTSPAPRSPLSPRGPASLRTLAVRPKLKSSQETPINYSKGRAGNGKVQSTLRSSVSLETGIGTLSKDVQNDLDRAIDEFIASWESGERVDSGRDKVDD